MSVVYSTFGGRVLAENRGGVIRQYLPDPLGNTAALADTTGTITDTYTYWPYGEVRTHIGTSTTPLTFLGTLGYMVNPKLRHRCPCRSERERAGGGARPMIRAVRRGCQARPRVSHPFLRPAGAGLGSPARFAPAGEPLTNVFSSGSERGLAAQSPSCGPVSRTSTQPTREPVRRQLLALPWPGDRSD